MVQPLYHLQTGVPVPVVGTEAVHCSKTVDRNLGKGLQNTAEDIAELQAAEGTALPAVPEASVVPGLPVVIEGSAVLERTVVVAGTDKESADKGRDTGIDPLLGPWGLLIERCSMLLCSLEHRRLGRIQDRFGSLRTTKMDTVNSL